MERSAKRARANTRGDTIPAIPPSPRHSTKDIWDMTKALPNYSQIILLNRAAVRHAHVTESLRAEYEKLRASAATRVRSFDHHRLEACRELNMRYEHMSTRTRAEMGPQVAETIEKMLETIAKETMPYSSFGTKFNALDTIRKIYTTVLVDDILHNSVRENLVDWGEHFVFVARLFARAELNQLSETEMKRTDVRAGCLWLDILEEVADEAREYFVEGDLQIEEALAILRGEQLSEEEEEDEEDDE